MKHVLVLALLFCCVPSVSFADNDLLTIGSKAPSLNIEHWITKGNDKFSQVTEFEPGRVYVVEFWATWCGPCIGIMPKLASLQDKYAEQGVQIISVTREKKALAEKFLKREYKGKGDAKTYADICARYSLTADPDESVYKSFKRAARQSGIPNAFIVGKTGHIEWIGHPAAMETPLQAVLEDRWDREPHAKVILRGQKLTLMREQVYELAKNDDIDQALKVVEEFIDNTDPRSAQSAKYTRFNVMLSKRPDSALEELPGILQEARGSQVLTYCNIIAESKMEDHQDKKKAAVKIANEYCQTLIKRLQQPRSKAIVLINASGMFESIRDYDEAIRLMKAALETISERSKPTVQKMLDKLESKKAEAEADGEKQEAPSE